MTERPVTDRRLSTSVALSEALLRKLDEFAQQRSVTRSAAVSLAVSEYLARVAERETQATPST